MAISPDEHLLPQSAPVLLQTFAASAKRIQDIPTPIDTVKRPLDVVPAFIPFVGWEYSVDVWFRTWPEATKRAISARSLQLHQKKGTAYCIGEYVRYAGGRVLKIERPPMTAFSGPSLTKAEREAWLSALPQVRVWLIREEGRFGPWKAFHGGYHHPRFFERSINVPSTALARLRRRARWVVDGAESDVRVSELGSWFRLHFKATEGRAVYSNRVHRHRYFVPSTAWRRLVTILPKARLAWRSPTGPTMQPVTSEPERVKVFGARGRSVFCNTAAVAYFVPSTAKYRIFDRYAVHDGRRVLRRPAFRFTGTGRYGFPSHTAYLHVSIPGRRSRFAAGSAIILPGLRFYVPHDPAPVENVRRAVQSAKRSSDRILLKIGPKPRFVAGQPFLAGIDHFIVGRP